jgi:hypothetical protein
VNLIEGEWNEEKKMFAELHRVLKPGGKIGVAAMRRGSLAHSIYRAHAGKDFDFENGNPYSRNELWSFARTARFTDISIHPFSLRFASYLLDSTSSSSLFFGKAADLLFRALDKAGQIGTKISSVGFFMPAEKQGDQNAIELAAMAKIKEEADRPLPTDRELKRVEIIVLKYKDPEVEWRAAKHILENTEWPYRMTFYDNRPNTRNMARAWNRLIKESPCDYVLIMDSDVFVPKLSPDWLTRLMANFNHKDCMVSMPKVTVTSCPEQQALKPEEKPAHEIRASFSGMCVLYKKEIFEKVGYFDEEFLLRGSDIEWAERFLKSPYKAYISPDIVVDHVGSYASKKADRKAEFSRNLERIYANTLFNKKRN